MIRPKDDAVAWEQEETDEVLEVLLDYSDEENMTKSGNGKLRFDTWPSQVKYRQNPTKIPKKTWQS